MTGGRPAVSVVVLAYGDEPWLREAVTSALGSDGIDVEVVLVDNGCTIPGLVDELAALGPRVAVVRPPENLGFAGGCNAGAERARHPVIAFLNGDATAEPSALGLLSAVLDDPEVGLATASVRLAEDPDLLNSSGNPLTVTGVSWAGHHGEPATAHAVPVDVPVVCGAGFAVTRATWDRLGGFDPLHFAYHEDTDLSLRCWQAGLRVRYVPDAVVLHRYEFHRNTLKMELLERNRWLNQLTLWERRTTVLMLPLMLLTEAGVLVLAATQGWLPSKLRAWRWLWRERRAVASRRRRVQGARVVADRDLLWLLTPEVTPGNLAMPPGARVLDAVVRGYWRLARRLV